jgi:RNA polymerase sigma-70 factor (ECF subfamily)
VVFDGARTVAAQALTFARFARSAYLTTVNGAPGLVTVVGGEVFSVQAFTVHDGRITEIDLHADRSRLRHLDTGLVAPR